MGRLAWKPRKEPILEGLRTKVQGVERGTSDSNEYVYAFAVHLPPTDWSDLLVMVRGGRPEQESLYGKPYS